MYEQYGMKGVEVILERQPDPRAYGHALIWAVRNMHKDLFLAMLEVSPLWALQNALKDVAQYGLSPYYAQQIVNQNPLSMQNNFEAFGGFLAHKNYDFAEHMLPYLSRKTCTDVAYRNISDPCSFPYSIHEKLLSLPLDSSKASFLRTLSMVCAQGGDRMFDLFFQQPFSAQTWAWILTEKKTISNERFERIMDKTSYELVAHEFGQRKQDALGNSEHYYEKRRQLFEEKYALYLKKKMTEAVEEQLCSQTSFKSRKI